MGANLFWRMLGSKKIEIKVEDELDSVTGQRFRSVLLESDHYKNTKRVSFCTIVKSSDQFLIETLRENLLANHRDRKQTEFMVLVPQGWEILERIKLDFSDELESSYLKIATYPENAVENTLRNICFQLAEGLILSNLESADYTGMRAGNFIYQEMISDIYDHVFWFKKKYRAPYRIACWRDTFFEIGGFDEMGKYQNQCSNLVSRLNSYGVESIIRTNGYFTKSLAAPPRRFFEIRRARKAKKLKMTRLDRNQIISV